jgi:hypothetical protein
VAGCLFIGRAEVVSDRAPAVQDTGQVAQMVVPGNSTNKRRKSMKHSRMKAVVRRLFPILVLSSLAILLVGCTGLAIRVASCPKNKATCDDSALKEEKLLTEPYPVSKTFVILVKQAQDEPITSLSATVTDSFSNTVSIDSADIYKPNTHTLLDPSYWAVRLNWPTLSAAGIRVEAATESRAWTVVIDATWDGNQETITHRFDVSD